MLCMFEFTYVLMGAKRMTNKTFFVEVGIYDDFTNFQKIGVQLLKNNILFEF